MIDHLGTIRADLAPSARIGRATSHAGALAPGGLGTSRRSVTTPLPTGRPLAACPA